MSFEGVSNQVGVTEALVQTSWGSQCSTTLRLWNDASDKHGMERYIIYESIISSKLCFMDMEPIWKAGDFYIYSIADTIALSAGSRPKSVELIRIFSSNKNPCSSSRRRTWPNTRTPFPYSPAAYISETIWHMSWKKSWCTKLENCLKTYLCASGMIYRFPEI